MKSFPLLVYKDKNNFYEEGCEKFISCRSIVLKNAVYLATLDTNFSCSISSRPGDEVPPHYPHTIKVMKILDFNLGIIYIEVTNFAFNCAAPDSIQVYTEDDMSFNGLTNDAVYSLDGNFTTDEIWMKSDADEDNAIIGTTDGGNDVMTAPGVGNMPAMTWKNVEMSIAGPVTLYFRNFVGNVAVKIYKRTL